MTWQLTALDHVEQHLIYTLRWRRSRSASPFLYQRSLLWLFGLSGLEAADHMLARLSDLLHRYQRRPGISPDCYAPRLTGQERALLQLLVDWESAADKPNLERVCWIVTASGAPRTVAIVAALAESLHRHRPLASPAQTQTVR